MPPSSEQKRPWHCMTADESFIPFLIVQHELFPFLMAAQAGTSWLLWQEHLLRHGTGTGTVGTVPWYLRYLLDTA